MTDGTADQGQGPTLIGSVRRAMRLLEAVAERHEGATAKRLARAAGLPLATTYHLLRTLVHDGYLIREGGLYAMGESARRLAGPADEQAARAELADWLGRMRDDFGAAVYYALYEDGEVNVVLSAAGAATPAVEEWAEFRRTAHAHAIGQCLLAQLDDKERRDHLARHPVEGLTPYTVQDERALLRRLARMDRGRPVHERQEYTPGTVCAAVPITAGTVPSALAISLPLDRADQLRPLARALQRRVEGTLTSLSFSVRS
ncbi:IclR family transcriptional regulator [Streptomyces sp. NPDC059002]|uniref:IclR family transcriptional regulator n=1 Tax=Streptomyces sp. NPDC059002 TaxID=3346690 RepID=UPI0036B3E553